MSDKVYIVCGPSGIGKSWVCNQLKNKFNYLSHDEHEVDEYADAIYEAAQDSTKPILGDAPFRTSDLIRDLRSRGLKTEAIYIVEPESTWVSRMIEREGPQGLTPRRIKQFHHLKSRAEQFGDFVGSSLDVLSYLNSK